MSFKVLLRELTYPFCFYPVLRTLFKIVKKKFGTNAYVVKMRIKNRSSLHV